jgi:prolipoprotein diacylglyceryltransferase
MALIAGAVTLTLAIAPPRTSDRRSMADAALGPAIIGLLAGRVTAILLDDPHSLTRPADILLLRGGVELWPGIAVGFAAAIVMAQRAGQSVGARLADAAPAALVAYAAYEAGCLLRSGCFGPSSRVGLAPQGLSTTVIPIGLFVAIAAVGVATMVRRCFWRDSITAIGFAVVGLALIRAVAAIWLPKIGAGLTRQHLESIFVLGGASLAMASRWVYHHLVRTRDVAMRGADASGDRER